MSLRARMLARIGLCAVAAMLVLAGAKRPLWDMKLIAPQYPQGLHIVAFGDRVTGDLREINILNQYIGMKEIVERPAREMALFPVAIGAILLLLAAGTLHRWPYRLAAWSALALPLAIVGDMQMQLRWYGHHLDAGAPLRLAPFTPLVLGASHVGQFMTSARLHTGAYLLLAAGAIMIAGLKLAGAWRVKVEGRARLAAATLLLFVTAFALPSFGATTLQQRIDLAPPRAVIVVDGGSHAAISIRKPMTLIGLHGAAIDGKGAGTVVTIDADDVTLRGFDIHNSGRAASEESAGVDVRGSRNVVDHNSIHDVHFGIHATAGERVRITGNRIRPGGGRGYRGGDGINLWSLRDSLVAGNELSDTRDGIYLSFTTAVTLADNSVTRARYAIHSMFSSSITIEGNVLRDNLLGAALMNSDRLVFRGNRVELNRLGATPYGVLLKDIGDLVLEDNIVARNRVGIYADGTPDTAEHHAFIRDNAIIGNDAGLALQNSVRLTVTGNALVDNLRDVAAEEGSLSSENVWTASGRGNYWSSYRGLDRNGDGVGDQPFTLASSFDYLLERNPAIRAFAFTPAHGALEMAASMFPLFRAQPLLTDTAPLMTSPPLPRLRREESCMATCGRAR